jgi:hypothetical protein
VFDPAPRSPSGVSAAPAEPPVPIEVVPNEPAVPDPGGDGLAGPTGGLWQQMAADPQYAPEHLALEAVRRLGPAALRWADQMRAHYPEVSPDLLADWAIRRFTNHARLSGAVSGAAGLPGAVADVGVLAWTQARMVLHVAAAYGVDPTHPDRATDLLILARVHTVAETARLALRVAAGRERTTALFTAANAPVGRMVVTLGVRLARMAGVQAARRVVAKLIPGVGMVLGTWANSAATADLARRTVTHYRPKRPGPAA